MTVDPTVQLILNLGAYIICALLGYFLSDLQSKLKDARAMDDIHTKKIHAIELQISDVYVKRVDFDRAMDVVFSKLDNIEKKVDEVKNHAVSEVNQIKINCAAFHGRDE